MSKIQYSPPCGDELGNLSEQKKCVVCGKPVTDGGKTGDDPIHFECYKSGRPPIAYSNPIPANVPDEGQAEGGEERLVSWPAVNPPQSPASACSALRELKEWLERTKHEARGFRNGTPPQSLRDVRIERAAESGLCELVKLRYSIESIEREAALNASGEMPMEAKKNL